MNKLSKLFVLVAILPVTLLVSAMVNAQENIAVVSLELAVLQTDLAKEQMKKQEENAVFKDKVSQLESLSKEVEEMAEKYKKDKAVLSPEQQVAQEQLLKSKENEGIAIQQQLLKTRQQIQVAIVRQTQNVVLKTARDVAAVEGIDILLNAQAVLYMKDVNDITAKVTDSLNKQFKK